MHILLYIYIYMLMHRLLYICIYHMSAVIVTSPGKMCFCLSYAFMCLYVYVFMRVCVYVFMSLCVLVVYGLFVLACYCLSASSPPRASARSWSSRRPGRHGHRGRGPAKMIVSLDCYKAVVENKTAAMFWDSYFDVEVKVLRATVRGTPNPPTKSFPTKSPWVKLSGRLPIKLYGHENSHPLELRVCLSQTFWNRNT